MARRFETTLAVAGILLTSACNRVPPGTYTVTPQQAFDRLKDEKLIDLRRSRQCGIVINFTPEAVSGSEIRWSVTSGGREVVWFRVLLTPVSATQTKAVVEVQPGKDGKEMYAGGYFTPHPAVVQPFRPAIEEAIAAKLEGRPFNIDPAPRDPDDDVCDVQRASIEAGRVFDVNDPPGTPPHQVSSK